MTPAIDTVSVLGVPVGAHTMGGLLERIEQLVNAPSCAVAYAVNAHALNLTYRDPAYLQALRQADLVYADGASVLLAARLLGTRLPEKLTTTDVWPRLCALAVRQSYRFFLLGGEPGLAERVATKTQAQYPGLRIVGTHHGYFDLEDESIVATINAAGPDILWVGMGDPRQALWAERVRGRLRAGLIITCGGMFKVLAGDLTRIPPQWRDRGFEWLYRLIQEPRLTWRRYLLGLPVFGLRVLAQSLLRWRGRRSAAVER